MSLFWAAVAIDSLVSKLNKLKPLSDEAIASKTGYLKESGSSPLFITWNTLPNHNLRGCIGTFTDIELSSGVRKYSLIAALEDSRFRPIKKSELPLLECCVTILNNFEQITNPYDWQIGVHGLRLEFEYNNNYYSGTFLPSVMEEQGWDKDETYDNLISKAGLRAHGLTIEKLIELGNVTIIRYKGDKNKLNVDNYMQL